MTQNAAMLHVRRAKGVQGVKNRERSVDKTHYRAKKTSADPWAEFPKGIIEAEWKSIRVPGPVRCLILSDVHIPYHDSDALMAAIEYGKKHEADTIILNGDIVDCFSISRWEKDPRQRNFANEIKTTKHFLHLLRRTFPKAKIIFKLGNHEERWEKYMYLKAPELLGVPDFEFEKLFGLAGFDIECVKDCLPIKLGKLNVIHGHEYRFSISNPVNPARGFYMRAKTHCIGGHLHQSSQHSETNLEGKTISCWSTGALCNLHPMYARINNWCLGFAFVTTDRNGAFEVQNLRIVDGKVY